MKIGKKVQRGISDSVELKNTYVWNAGIDSPVPTGTPIFFFFFFIFFIYQQR